MTDCSQALWGRTRSVCVVAYRYGEMLRSATRSSVHATCVCTAVLEQRGMSKTRTTTMQLPFAVLCRRRTYRRDLELPATAMSPFSKSLKGKLDVLFLGLLSSKKRSSGTQGRVAGCRLHFFINEAAW